MRGSGTSRHLRGFLGQALQAGRQQAAPLPPLREVTRGFEGRRQLRGASRASEACAALRSWAEPARLEALSPRGYCAHEAGPELRSFLPLQPLAPEIAASFQLPAFPLSPPDSGPEDNDSPGDRRGHLPKTRPNKRPELARGLKPGPHVLGPAAAGAALSGEGARAGQACRAAGAGKALLTVARG